MITEDQAKRGAKWWAQQIIDPTFKTLSPEERDDPSSASAAMSELMARAAAKGATREQAAAFEAELQKRILIEQPRSIACDYHPDGILHESAEKAGIQVGITTFPWKTCMLFQEDGVVKAGLGYRTPFVDV